MLGSARLAPGSGLEGPASAGPDGLTSAASLRGISPSQYESPLTFGSSRSLEDKYDVDSIYLNQEGRLGGSAGGYSGLSDAGSRFSGAGSGVGTPTGAGSTALYHHHGSRYGLAMGARIQDNKMNGLHGAKHKRGEIDRKFSYNFNLGSHMCVGLMFLRWVQ